MCLELSSLDIFCRHEVVLEAHAIDLDMWTPIGDLVIYIETR